MKVTGNIDPTLRMLAKRMGRYQALQVSAVMLGSIGASYQLFVNIFIGKAVEGLQCATPGNQSFTAANGGEEVVILDWNSSDVEVGQCQITVSNNNLSEQHYPCPFGYQYGYDRELSFRTEFDLVCDRKLLGSLLQTLVIAGQGVGAVASSFLSDRYGRKPILIGSQFGLFLLGIGVGLAPSYTMIAALKFLIGAFQQGVVTCLATMGIELFPMETRSMQMLIGSFFWGVCTSSLALVAYLMRYQPWRHLQYAVSAFSFFVCLIQLGCVEESIRWLVANGKKEAAVRVLKKAARMNRKDENVVLNLLQDEDTDPEGDKKLDELTTTETEAKEEEKKESDKGRVVTPEAFNVETTLTHKQTQKLTVLDIFRHKRLLGYAIITWIGWFVCAFSFFSLYLMSTSLHGDNFLNFFFTCLMDFPSSILLFYMVDKVGRRTSVCSFYALTAFGLASCGTFRVFKGNSLLGTLSVVCHTIGAFGASAAFSGIFMYTQEYFPTNMRNQALGAASFAGRFGGMLGPFMTDLAEIAVWAPGALTGGLCLLVVVLYRFLPETKNQELPHTIDDIKSWSSAQNNYKIR